MACTLPLLLSLSFSAILSNLWCATLSYSSGGNSLESIQEWDCLLNTNTHMLTARIENQNKLTPGLNKSPFQFIFTLAASVQSWFLLFFSSVITH